MLCESSSAVMDRTKLYSCQGFFNSNKDKFGTIFFNLEFYKGKNNGVITSKQDCISIYISLKRTFSTNYIVYCFLLFYFVYPVICRSYNSTFIILIILIIVAKIPIGNIYCIENCFITTCYSCFIIWKMPNCVHKKLLLRMSIFYVFSLYMCIQFYVNLDVTKYKCNFLVDSKLSATTIFLSDFQYTVFDSIKSVHSSHYFITDIETS